MSFAAADVDVNLRGRNLKATKAPKDTKVSLAFFLVEYIMERE